MRRLYLILAVLGAVIPYSAFVPWAMAHGLDMPRFVSEMFGTPIASFFSLDVVLSALAVFALVGRGMRRGVPHAWLAVVGTLTVGVSLGLPLFLYLEARHEDGQRGPA